MNKNKTFGDQLLEIRAFIDHGMFMPEIISRLEVYGFGYRKMIMGRNLLIATHIEYEKHNKTDCEKQIDEDIFLIKFNQVYENFARHRGRAKVAFRNNDYILNDFLSVTKGHPVKYSDWIVFTRRFYINTLASNEIIQGFNYVFVTEKELRQALTKLEQLDRLRVKQGELNRNTDEIPETRNEKYFKLSEWYNEALSIARIALKDVPHLLEALGVQPKMQRS